MQSQNSFFNDDLLISGQISAILSPIVIILISVTADEWPDGDAVFGPRFIFFWGLFAMIGTVIFFIISSFTKEGLSVLVRGRMGSDYETIEKDLEIILPLSAPPSETISKEKTQESHSDENILESEKAPEVEESSMEKLEKLIERRNAGEVTSKEFEEIKKKILERKPQINKEPVEVAQEEADTPIKKGKGSAINNSNVGAGSSKMQELKDLTEMKEKGLIDDDEFKQMKKEILGK